MYSSESVVDAINGALVKDIHRGLRGEMCTLYGFLCWSITYKLYDMMTLLESGNL